jgi:hypothetical protein
MFDVFQQLFKMKTVGDRLNYSDPFGAVGRSRTCYIFYEIDYSRACGLWSSIVLV